jgi:dTDP-4-dehydrorhamnose reductase
MPVPILIAGAMGQVGRELAAATSTHALHALTRAQLDITDSDQVEQVFERYKPGIVINAAAYTQVDRAESEPELAYAINRDGVANLARACASHDIALLHISTDYVFAGDKPGAYREEDATLPAGTYGASKLEGEVVLREALERHIILRTSWVFSASGANFVKTMLRLGRERAELGIVDDQHGCPTSARSIAGVLLMIADRYLQGGDIEWGTYHYCNQPETTWYGFARQIFRLADGYEKLRLKAIATSDYPTPAARPLNSVLDCSKLKANFGYSQSGWVDELRQVLGDLRAI